MNRSKLLFVVIVVLSVLLAQALFMMKFNNDRHHAEFEEYNRYVDSLLHRDSIQITCIYCGKRHKQPLIWLKDSL